jgi:uncharacterized protein (TIGR03435 family)
MRSRASLFVPIGVALLTLPAFCAVKVGDHAPEITLEALIPNQPVENASLESLAGKAIVLEFWATWCGPCVDAIPHLNELADRFADRPIRFISVTDEDSAVVEKFLKQRPIHGWVGFDHAKRMNKTYGFEGVPDVVLIDASGKIAGITHPAMLKPENLEDLLAGKALKLPPVGGPDMSISRTSLDGGPAPMLDIIVRPSSGGNSGMANGQGRFQVKGFTLRAILVNVYQTDSAFVEGGAVDDQTRYDVAITAPRSQDQALRKMLPDLLAMAFQIEVKHETRELEGWILKAPHGKPDILKESPSIGSSSSWGGGKIHVTGGNMAQVAKIAQSVLGKPVVDQTGISGKFDFDFKYDQKAPESVVAALRECGFEFEPAKLPIQFVIANKVGQK